MTSTTPEPNGKRDAHVHVTAELRNCARCGGGFEARRPHARYCSARCRVEASRETRNSEPVSQSAGQTNVVQVRPRQADPPVTRQPVVRGNTPDRWRCGCCYHLQAVGSVDRCEFCGWPRHQAAPQ